MTKQQLKSLIGINLLTILLVISPFLPGPGFLSKLTNTIFSLAQISSVFGLLLMPVGLLRTIKQRSQQDKKLLPLLLWTVPLCIIIFSIWGAGFAREISRQIAMHNAQNLITAIEIFRTANDHYPENISQLQPSYIKNIPQPWIMGISGYTYEKKDDHFNLSFTQNVLLNFNFEVMIHDPMGNHTA